MSSLRKEQCFTLLPWVIYICSSLSRREYELIHHIGITHCCCKGGAVCADAGEGEGHRGADRGLQRVQGGHREAQGAPGRQGGGARGAPLCNPLQGTWSVPREAAILGVFCHSPVHWRCVHGGPLNKSAQVVSVCGWGCVRHIAKVLKELLACAPCAKAALQRLACAELDIASAEAAL